MSDADDQMGGTPSSPQPQTEEKEGKGRPHKEDEQQDQKGEDSFPASDPPADY